MSLPKFLVLTYAPLSFFLISIINVSPKSHFPYSNRNNSSKNCVVVQVIIVGFESQNGNTIRQAPHYYKPYFDTYDVSLCVMHYMQIWIGILFTLHLESLFNLLETSHLNNGNGKGRGLNGRRVGSSIFWLRKLSISEPRSSCSISRFISFL